MDKTASNSNIPAIPELSAHTYRRPVLTAIKFVGAACSLALGSILVRRAFHNQLQDQSEVDGQVVLSVRTLTAQGRCHEAVRQLMATHSLVTRNAGLHEIGTAQECNIETRLAAFRQIHDDGRIGEIAATNLITLHIQKKQWNEAIEVIKTKVKSIPSRDKHLEMVLQEMRAELAALREQGELNAVNALMESLSALSPIGEALRSMNDNSIPEAPFEERNEQITKATPEAVEYSTEGLESHTELVLVGASSRNPFNDPGIMQQMVQAKLKHNPPDIREAMQIALKAPTDTQHELLKSIAWRAIEYGLIPNFLACATASNILETAQRTLAENHWGIAKLVLDGPEYLAGFLAVVCNDPRYVHDLRLVFRSDTLKYKTALERIMHKLRECSSPLVPELLTIQFEWKMAEYDLESWKDPEIPFDQVEHPDHKKRMVLAAAKAAATATDLEHKRKLNPFLYLVNLIRTTSQMNEELCAAIVAVPEVKKTILQHNIWDYDTQEFVDIMQPLIKADRYLGLQVSLTIFAFTIWEHEDGFLKGIKALGPLDQVDRDFIISKTVGLLLLQKYHPGQSSSLYLDLINQIKDPATIIKSIRMLGFKENLGAEFEERLKQPTFDLRQTLVLAEAIGWADLQTRVVAVMQSKRTYECNPIDRLVITLLTVEEPAVLWRAVRDVNHEDAKNGMALVAERFSGSLTANRVRELLLELSTTPLSPEKAKTLSEAIWNFKRSITNDKLFHHLSHKSDTPREHRFWTEFWYTHHHRPDSESFYKMIEG